MNGSALAAGERIDGRYELVARLGDGTFGEVWRALDTRLSQRPVAVKVLKSEFLDRPEMVARFESEADALARLAHPSVVAVLDRGAHHGSRYIVTELVEGAALSAWLEEARRSGSPPGLVTARALFDQVCAGVEAAHQVEVPGPIVHRDLKPDNIVVRRLPSGDLVAKVLDFGIAQLGGRQGTRTGMMLGTPLYMAPEQAMGQVAGVGPWTDVFALAVILVEVLTLRATPAGEETWWATALRSGGDVMATLTALRGDVPPAVWATVARALHPDGPRRFASAGMFRAALRAAWEVVPGVTVPKTTAMETFTPPGAQGFTAPQTVASWGQSTGPTGTVGMTATGGAAAPHNNPWPQQPQYFPAPVPTAHSGGNSGAFTWVVMGGLFVALVGATGAWAFLRANRTTSAVAAAPEAPPAPPPAYPDTARPPAPTPSRPQDDPDRVYALADNPEAPSQGPANAPVTLVIISDFQCPFCARVRPTIERLRQAYGRQLRVVWRNYPLAFHQNAMPAAEAALEARAQRGDAGFWRMHDVLFENQRALTRPDLERYAEALGLDLRRFRQALDARRHQPAIRADMAAVGAALTGVGTPTFLVNGRMVRGAQPYERFAAAVDRALSDARR